MSTPLIVLLHGAGGNRLTMLALYTYLRTWTGLERIVRPYYSSNVSDIDAAVDDVDSQIALHASRMDDDVIIVGQSLGGVIGYRIATSTRFRVRLLITIGSPLHGAALVGMLRERMTEYAYTTLVHRPVYAELERQRRVEPPRVPYHCFTTGWGWSSFDGCVFVDEARFDDEHHTHLSWGDHRFIIADPRLVTSVASKIKHFIA